MKGRAKKKRQSKRDPRVNPRPGDVLVSVRHKEKYVITKLSDSKLLSPGEAAGMMFYIGEKWVRRKTEIFLEYDRIGDKGGRVSRRCRLLQWQRFAEHMQVVEVAPETGV